MNRRIPDLTDDPLWYKDAIIYQLHVKTFCDANGDGIGDFKGLTQKLDYLHDLGVTTLWLQPFCPSPLKDDGYDIAGYTDVHPAYGNLGDFKQFLREAHHRGLRVITELVVNHTSDQHPWFQRARQAKPGTRWRDFYVWSDTPDRYKETRIIFQDFESSNWAWDPIAKAYYWHRFYSHQPDLNYDNPQVQKAIFRVLDFWFEMGVDGLRLDAVPYLFEREGTNCENLPQTHQFLKKLRSQVDNKFSNRMFLGEANQWPEDAVEYFGDGDECHMAFHFPLMPRLFMALRMEDRFPILDILDQTPTIPTSSQWALFLRNHDELTLEMVTDEERDYMYRVYAQDPQMRLNLGIRRRLAPLLGNHRRRIEFMNGLLFSMPGTPVIYYGDEIGMGDNVYLGDRNGVRTPMQWSSDRNAGFSRANPQKLYLPVIIDPEYHYEVVNVEAQQSNPHALLWWMKRLMILRKRFKAFGRGSIEFLHPENAKVMAFMRRHEDENILVVANLSRFVQHVDLDLSSYMGLMPVEAFGRIEFPPIGKEPYFLTLGPHSFYWFALIPPNATEGAPEISSERKRLPTLETTGRWDNVLKGKGKAQLEALIPDYLRAQRWFGGKARQIKSAVIQEVLPASNGATLSYFTFVRVEYMDGDGETYVLPLTFAPGEKVNRLKGDRGLAAVARLSIRDKEQEGILLDALLDRGFCEALLQGIAHRQRRKGSHGELIATLIRAFQEIRPRKEEPLQPSVLRAEQSNTSVVYGNSLILKVFRRLQPGMNPDLEIGRFLTERRFSSIPPVVGALEYRKEREEPTTLAILEGLVPNQGDAWSFTLDTLGHYFENILVQHNRLKSVRLPESDLLTLAQMDPPLEVRDLIGTYVEAARLLGQRTAELHLALSSAKDDKAFLPEGFSKLYQRSLYQSMRTLTGQVFRLLRQRMGKLPEKARKEAQGVLDLEKTILERFRGVLDRRITALRLRCHGDYHLGQVLYTGKDFVIIDFEGEPARPLSERKIKRSPLRDVAGMLRSFHYASYSALLAQEAQGLIHHKDISFMESWASLWHLWVCGIFLKPYLEIASQGEFLPKGEEETRLLLNAYLLEKAIYELGYELNNRPDWVKIPIRGIKQLLGAERD